MVSIYISDHFLQIISHLFLLFVYIWMEYPYIIENKREFNILTVFFSVITFIFLYKIPMNIIISFLYLILTVILNKKKNVLNIFLLFIGYFIVNNLGLVVSSTQETLYFMMLKLIATDIYFFIFQIYLSVIEYVNKNRIFIFFQIFLFVTCIGANILILFNNQFMINETRDILYFPIFVISILYIVLSILIYYYNDYQEMNEMVRIHEIKNEIINKQYFSLKQKYEEISILKHDINNHLQTLYILSVQDNKGVKEYLKTYISTMSEYSLYFKSDNQMLEIVINEKYIEARDKNINFEVECENTNLMFLEDIDIVTIFCNLLDNAIEANDNILKDKFIKVIITERDNYNVIQIINSFSNSVTVKKNRIITTKKGHLGLGLTSVKKSVEKYSGLLTFETEDDKFTIALLFPFNQNIIQFEQ